MRIFSVERTYVVVNYSSKYQISCFIVQRKVFLIIKEVFQNFKANKTFPGNFFGRNRMESFEIYWKQFIRTLLLIIPSNVIKFMWLICTKLKPNMILPLLINYFTQYLHKTLFDFISNMSYTSKIIILYIINIKVEKTNNNLLNFIITFNKNIK